MKGFKSILIILTLFLLFGKYSFSQEKDSLVYIGSFKLKKEIPPRQVHNILTIYSDSSYKWTTYIGNLEDKKQNYQNWRKSESIGKWKLQDKKFLDLIYGDTKTQFIKKKNKIKVKRFQQLENGGYKTTYNLWLFERKTKFYLKQID